MVYHFVRFMAAIPFPMVILVLLSLGICLAILTKDLLGFSRFTFIFLYLLFSFVLIGAKFMGLTHAAPTRWLKPLPAAEKTLMLHEIWLHHDHRALTISRFVEVHRLYQDEYVLGHAKTPPDHQPVDHNLRQQLRVLGAAPASSSVVPGSAAIHRAGRATVHAPVTDLSGH